MSTLKYRNPSDPTEWLSIITTGQKGDSGVWYGTDTPPSGYEAWIDPSGSAGWGDLLEVIYPVGSIYMSMNSTNPGTWFGGTWERIKDAFLLALGDSGTVGDTGGEATHTLTVNEMPSHQHSLTQGPANNAGQAGTGTSEYGSVRLNAVFASGYKTDNTGGGQAHNNMPPYIKVYMWQRTA